MKSTTTLIFQLCFSLFFHILFSTSTNGQITKIDSILASSELLVANYKPTIKSDHLLLLEMAYGSTSIKNKETLEKLKGATIASIDIIYSDHPKGGDFSTLTKKRLKALQKLHPKLFQNPNITWRLIRQTACSSKATAQQLFHGFVICYRPKQAKEEIEKEITFLENLLSEKKESKTISPLPSELPEEEETVVIPTYDTLVGSDGELLFRPGIGLKDSVTYSPEELAAKKALKEKKNKPIFPKGYVDKDRWYKKGHEISPYSPSSHKHSSFYNRKPDSTVFKVLERNNWNNMLIVSDVTGSMSPYTGQLLMWLRFNTISDRVKHFVFFNDGDRKNYFEKVIGKTGGIYNIPSSEYEEVKELVFQAMRNGNGGDNPENDIEALIAASKLCPDCDNLVLIADNWSPIKDLKLLKKIKKPIKIILCGSDHELNTEYLDLARATGGSVHTMEDDLVNLMDIKEGQTIKFGNKEYIIEHGKFVRLRRI